MFLIESQLVTLPAGKADVCNGLQIYALFFNWQTLTPIFISYQSKILRIAGSTGKCKISDLSEELIFRVRKIEF
ncbi:MAG: hypothetical protein K2M85_07820, partial [Paramuribaculum sp.]|nr:hypothetical protein [Paramuribaculum sp.]